MAPSDQRRAAIAARPNATARSPEDEVLDGEKERAARPLEGRRETGDRAREDLELPQIVDPARVEAEGEGARPEKDVRQEDPDGHRGRGEQEKAAGNRREDLPEHPAAGPPACERPNEQGDADRREKREGRDLARRGQADRRPRQGVAGEARTVLGDPDRPEERRGGEGREDGIDGPEVGELDAQRAEGREARGEERGAAVREAARDPVDEPHGDEVEEARERAADQVRLAVALLPEQRRHGLGQDHRQRSVDEGALAAVVGVERRAFGIEVGAGLLREGQLLLDHRDEALVGMEVMALVPVRPWNRKRPPSRRIPRRIARARRRGGRTPARSPRSAGCPCG